MLKDYYKILDIPPNAGPAEIKKSFRRLAMRYHPDKHDESHTAVAQFREIQEAYETLMDPLKKENYLQLRWYEQSMGRKLSDPRPMTSSTVLQDAVRLNRYVFTLNPFRIDSPGLLYYELQLLNDDAVSILKQENNSSLINELVRLMVASSRTFRFSDARKLADRLKLIITEDSVSLPLLDEFLQTRKKQDRWHKWKIVFFLAVTLLLCYIIYRAART